MAKIVIAGRADCPYYSRIELLADRVAGAANDFKVHKIVKKPEDWENWLKTECGSRQFNYSKSPIVWRELVDRGGKGVLIGGANEFQEYVWEYYGIKSSMDTSDMKKVGEENLKAKIEIDQEIEDYKKLSNPMKICITNASSPVCYQMLNAVSSGEVFGNDTELSINLLDIEENERFLGGTELEVSDLAHNPVRAVTVLSNKHQALTDCEAVVILDELTQASEEEEEVWVKRYCDYYVDLIKLIEENCRENVKVLLATGTGPANTALMMMHQAVQKLQTKNIVSLPRIIENQAKAIISRKVNVNSSDVVDVIIWGDQEKYCSDINQTRIHNHDGPIWGPPSYSRLVNILIHEEQWMSKDFHEALQARQATETEKMRHGPYMAKAAAICTFLKQWWSGAEQENFYTLAVPSQGLYDIPEGLIFNQPVRLHSDGTWSVVEDIEITEETKTKIKECVDHLLEKKYILFPELRPPPPPEPEPQVSESEATSHAPAMTPIKEETDLDISRQTDASASEATATATDDDAHAAKTPPGDPTLAQITEEPTEAIGNTTPAAATSPTVAASPTAAASPEAAAAVSPSAGNAVTEQPSEAEPAPAE